MIRKQLKLMAVTATTAAAAATTYGLVVRPWMTRWGATDDELERGLPGDELLTSPAMSVTRAITIDATPAEIWPWLVQIGQGRGGFYSYDWLENLFRLDIHTAEEILPEYQHVQVDDFIPFAPQQGMGMMVARLEPEHALVLFAPDPHFAEALQQQLDEPDFEMESSWAFVLQPVDERQTRLIVRFRMSTTADPVPAGILSGVLEPVHFIMERKMLLGIRERVERGREPLAVPATRLEGVA